MISMHIACLKFIRLYSVFIKKKILIYSEKMGNSGNYNHNCAHSLSGKDF